jgi:hypothetical protein
VSLATKAVTGEDIA